MVKTSSAKSSSKKRVKRTTARPSNVQKPLSRSLRVYQKVAIVFVVVSLLLLLGVLYLSLSSAAIHITPEEEIVSVNVPVEIAVSPSASTQIRGSVVQQSFQKAREFQVPQEGGVPIEAKAHGTVTLINETESQADLVARTRLLSEEGVLFRLDNAVSIPANGQIETTVSADQPGLAGEIGPTQFTIPGLPAASQTVVYAVSVDKMVGGVEYRRAVTQEDLDQAVMTLRQEILEESKTVLRQQAGSAFDGEDFTSDVVEKASDTEPGTESGSFNVSVTVRVTGVFYDRQTVTELAQAGLYERVQDGYSLASVNLDGLQIGVQNVSTSQGTANLQIYLDGVSTIATNNPNLSVDQFLGVSASDVESKLASVPGVKSVQVSFTPFWLKRVPTLKDHIKVIIDAPDR